MKLLLIVATDLVSASCSNPDGYDAGDYVECPDQSFMKGWCASGEVRDCCGGSCSHQLLCCTDFIVPRKECYLKSGDAGQYIVCDRSSAVVGTCGSGKNRDCNARFLSQMYNQTGIMVDEEELRDGSLRESSTLAFCCAHDLKVSDYGYWQHAGCGWDLECRPSQIVTGICGSGKNADCQNPPNVRGEESVQENPIHRSVRQETVRQGNNPEQRGCSQNDRYTAIYCVDVIP